MEDKDWQDLSHLPSGDEIEWGARFKKRITNFVTLFVGHQRPLHLQEGEIWLDPPAWSALKAFVQRYDLDPSVEEEDFVDVVFDGPPDAKSGRFVEVEDSKKRSVKIGRWIQRNNGQWALRIPLSVEAPAPTAEQIVAEAMVNAGAPLMHSRVEEAVCAALRAHGLLSEGVPSEEQIERAARAINALDWTQTEFGEVPHERDIARAALTAAGVAPQEPQMLDPEKVAEVIQPYDPDTPEDAARAICEAHLKGRLA